MLKLERSLGEVYGYFREKVLEVIQNELNNL